MPDTFIAILRGINVSGQKKIKMAELRQQLITLGLQDLTTYIQSGNLVFRAEQSAEVLAQSIQQSILDYFGFQVPTLVFPSNKLQKLITANPFQHEDLSKLYVTFLASSPDDELTKSLEPSANPNEKFKVDQDVIYVYCPDGYGRTKINNMFFERKLKVTATTRNWKTCLKLQELSNEIN